MQSPDFCFNRLLTELFCTINLLTVEELYCIAEWT